MDVIYTRTGWTANNIECSWCRIEDSDEKYINIETIIDRFRAVIEGKGLVIPRVAIKVIVDELKAL
jgi:hypothetical protein